MDRLKYEIVELLDGKRYFVLEDVFYEYDVYNLLLNLEDENDIDITLQEVKGGKNVLTKVTDRELLKKIAPLFEEKLRNKVLGIN